MHVTTIGLDIAKSVFQVYGVDAHGRVGRSSAAEASVRAGFLQEALALPGGHRGLRHIASLVTGAAGARPHRPVDAAGLREGLPETMPPMPRRSARPLPGQTCGLSRPRRQNSKGA